MGVKTKNIIMKKSFILWFREIGKGDVAIVGGKNASLGEMITKTKVPVPYGFAITAHAYDYYILKTGLKDYIREKLEKLDAKKLKSLQATGRDIRHAIATAKMPKELEKVILGFYDSMCRKYRRKVLVAVRSSATAEDLPDASFAGQQETYLNVGRDKLIDSVKKCFASLFTDRAISYRDDKGFDHFKVKLSVGIQKMINSKSSGVMFTIDPDSGFRGLVVVEGIYGLGELIVQGKVTPDEYRLFKATGKIVSKKLGSKEKMLIKGRGKNVQRHVSSKMRSKFILKDREVRRLADYGIAIEKHYKRPMDIEWARDDDNKLYIVQARPETIHGVKELTEIEKYVLKGRGKTLVKGQAIGRKIASGKVKVIMDVKNIRRVKPGDVLVTEMTDPDWEPVMKISSAIVTNKGGKTCHAAIISREMGIPCVVGTTNATKALKDGMQVTVDCTEKEGKVYKGKLNFKIEKQKIKNIPKTRTKVCVNVGVPEEALHASMLPVDGVGLAREEFIINSYIGEHPLHMIEEGRSQEYIDKLAEGVAGIAMPFYPREIIVRFSDFKTNEYAGLKGGAKFEPKENNPMIGYRGASRYINKQFEPAFRLECKAMRKVREKWGLRNVSVMVPFCRTINEAKAVLKIMKKEGMSRGKKGLKVYVMAEIPSNIISAEEFARYFDGFSIGSNDLTQLTLGIDRDNEMLQKEFDERNSAVKDSISHLLKVAKKHKKYVGICGEAPSNYPEYLKFLVKEGITAISVNPEVAIRSKLRVAKFERKK
jgi:pyruvate,water dikinase